MQTAYNPQTGEYLGLINGQWSKLQTASDGKGNTVYLDAASQSWQPLKTQAAVKPTEEWDRESGAPYKARFSIGSASDMDTKEARARAFFGDSVRREGDDNFSYLDPKTGKRTLVNPEGFDLGDLFGGGREIVSAAASIPAGIAGMVAGPGTSIGAGAAAGAAGGQAADALAAYLARSEAKDKGNAVPQVQSMGDAAKEAGIDTALGVAGGATMAGLGKAASGLLNPLEKKVVDAYRALGQQIPSLSAAAKMPGLAARVENIAGSMFGGGRIGDAAQKAQQQNAQSLTKIAQGLAGKDAAGQQMAVPQTVEELGQAAIEAGQRGRQAMTDYYNEGLKQLGADNWGANPAQAENLKRVIGEILGDTTGETRAALEGQLRGPLQAVLNDADNGVLNFVSLRAAKQALGETLRGAPTMNTQGLPQAYQRRLYGALKEDLRDSIGDADVRAAFDDLQRQYATRKQIAEKLDKAFGRDKTSAQMGRILMDPKKMDKDTVEALRSYIPAEDFNRLRAGIVQQLGRGRGGQGVANEAPAGTILQRVSENAERSYTPEAQNVLFGNALNDLKTVAQAQANAGKAYNFSNTANQLAVMDQVKNALRGVQGAFAGTTGALGAYPAAAASVLLPNAVARANTNPRLLNWLAKEQSPWARALLEQIMPITGTTASVAAAQ